MRRCAADCLAFFRAGGHLTKACYHYCLSTFSIVQPNPDGFPLWCCFFSSCAELSGVPLFFHGAPRLPSSPTPPNKPARLSALPSFLFARVSLCPPSCIPPKLVANDPRAPITTVTTTSTAEAKVGRLRCLRAVRRHGAQGSPDIRVQGRHPDNYLGEILWCMLSTTLFHLSTPCTATLVLPCVLRAKRVTLMAFFFCPVPVMRCVFFLCVADITAFHGASVLSALD